MMRYLVCFAGLFLYSEITALEIVQCKSGGILPTSFTISDCNQSPCTLKKGATKTIALEFTADDDYQDLVLIFQATYMGVTKGYPGYDGKTACPGIYSLPDNAQVGCPIQKGKTYKYEFVLKLKLPLPTATVAARLALKDKATKKEFVCTATSLNLTS